MNENVKCERSPAINYCQKSSQIRLMMHLLSEASICQEMCLEHRLDIFLEKKMLRTVLFRVNRISHTRTPKSSIYYRRLSRGSACDFAA